MDATTLQNAVDRMLAADRQYFTRFPARRHRVRLATAAEVTLAAVTTLRSYSVPPGARWFACCRCDGERVFVLNAAWSETDLPEAVAAAVWAQAMAVLP